MDLALRKAQEDCTESYLLTEGLKLERELNAANERIKRLEESENRLLNWLTEDCPESVKKQLSNAWIKYKEAKP
jgi:predicted nuclease with TOPRIM domain